MRLTPLPVRRNIFLAGLLALLLALFLTLAGAACNGPSGSPPKGPEGPDETTAPENRRLEVRGVYSSDSGGDVGRPMALASGSPTALASSLPSGADPRLSRRLRSSPESGFYLALFRGEERTGGYAVEVESARLSGDEVRIMLRLEDPPEGAMVAQEITTPCTVVRIEDLDPSDVSDKDFVFTDSDGRVLEWPVRRVGS